MSAGNAAPPAEVRDMFDRIAPIYDVMNTLMTAGLDARWRRAAVAAAAVGPGAEVVDVACGTGALTRDLARAVAPRGSVIGIDIAAGMLRRARRRPPGQGAPMPRYVQADALALPVADATADAAAIAFGLRNVPDYEACLAEMARVTRPGGRVVVLELAAPEGGLGRALAATWFQRAVPLLGRAVGAAAAYRYLPASVDGYPPPVEIAALMARVGLSDVGWRRLSPGLVTLHAGRRP